MTAEHQLCGREQAESLRVWDLPVRLGHWLMVMLVSFSWLSAENRWMEWHRYSGYALAGLLAFRIYWGLFGSSTARFAQFLCGPKKVTRYALALSRSDKRYTKYDAYPGHNPLGGWGVVALLLLLISQTALGLFTIDVDGLESGPLAQYISFETGRQVAAWHDSVFNILLAFVVVHTGAIAAHYLLVRHNLIVPMLTGVKPRRSDNGMPPHFVSGWCLAIGIGIAVLVVLWLALLS